MASGLSSCYILKSLAQRAGGKLISIDLPNYEEILAERIDGYPKVSILPKDKQTGWLIPDNLRDRWKLVLGRTQEVLQKVLEDCGKVDIFLHDSEHTYDCMIYEWTTAWEHLRPGGLLLSDDVHWNDAFLEFASLVHRQQQILAGHFGGILK